MAAVKPLAEQLRELRIDYENEAASKRDSFASRKAKNKEKVAKVKAYDYAAKYIARYNELFAAMDKLWADIKRVEDGTVGLQFKTANCMKTVKPERFAPSDGENYFEDLSGRCAACAEMLGKKLPLSDYELALKEFCTLYKTAQYYRDNGDRIVADCGAAENDRQHDLDDLADEAQKIKTEEKEAFSLQNFSCYPKASALIADVKASSAKVKSDLLGSDNFYYDNSFKYLIGFWKDKIAPLDEKFAQEALGLAPAELNGQPIYFDPQSGINNIIINVSGEDFKTGKYFELVKRLYFTIMSRLRKNSLRYSSIACGRLSKRAVDIFHKAIANQLEKGIEKDKSQYIDGDCVVDAGGVKSLISAHGKKNNDLMADLLGRSIYEYNKSAHEDPQGFRMLYIDCYPEGFSASYGANYEDLWQVMYDNVDSGDFVVVTQNADAEFPASAKKLDGNDQDLHSIFIDITDPSNATVNGRAAVLDIALPQYTEWDFWKKLNAYYQSKEIYTTKQMLYEVDRNGGVSGGNNGVFTIPVGKTGDKILTLDFNTNSACHSFIYGVSGAGKTSFLHNFIVSLCYNYTPEQIEFYIADFKNELTLYADDVRRIPHVKYYLATDPSADNARTAVSWVDMVRMIEQIRSTRQKEIDRLRNETGEAITDIVAYNKFSRKKMPYMFVLIDEWQGMLELNKDDRSVQRDFTGVLNAVLSLARSAGIAIILTGQRPLDIFSIAEKNITNKIYLSMPAENLRSDRAQNEEDARYLSVTNDGRVIYKKGENTVTQFRFAFPGSNDTKVDSSLIEMIREKYKNAEIYPIIKGGSVDPFYFSQKSEPQFESMLVPVRNSSGGIDEEAYPVYVGVTASFANPVPLDFSYNKNYCGYTMYTKEKDRIKLFLRSLCVSFLYKTAHTDGANKKYAAEGVGQRIKFFATKNIYANDIGDGIIKDYPALGAHVAHYDVKGDLYGACCEFMDLRELYNKRKNNDVNELEKPLPVLVILHEVEWLLDRDALNAAINGSRQNESSTEEVDVQIDEKDIERTFKILRLNPMYRSKSDDEVRRLAILQEKANMQKKSGSSAPAKKRERFTASDVEEAFRELYAKGNTYGIFLFVAGSAAYELNSLRKGLPDKEGLAKNTVFGCYSEASSGFGKSDKDIPDVVNVCYVNPGQNKTRIYELGAAGDKTFMRELERKLGE